MLGSRADTNPACELHASKLCESHADPDAKQSHTDTDSDSHSNCDGYTDAYGYADPKGYSNAKASSDTSSSSVGLLTN